jgi:hypothetical protein
MEFASLSETSVNFYQTTRRSNSEDWFFRCHQHTHNNHSDKQPCRQCLRKRTAWATRSSPLLFSRRRCDFGCREWRWQPKRCGRAWAMGQSLLLEWPKASCPTPDRHLPFIVNPFCPHRIPIENQFLYFVQNDLSVFCILLQSVNQPLLPVGCVHLRKTSPTETLG